MGLFSILASQASETGKRSLSLELPSIVQLYHSKPFVLESTALVPAYAFLSYSAVPVGQKEDLDTAAASASNSAKIAANKKALPIVPELGVWNVCVHKRGSDAAMLLPGSPSTFCLTVDLSKPNQVEPTLSLLQDALIRYLIDKPPPSNEPPSETATTSLYTLRSVAFGLAPDDEESASKMKGEAPDENDRNVMFTLVICARLPSTGTSPSSTASGAAGAPTRLDVRNNNDDTDNDHTNDYRSQQAQTLLLYHLRRYANALNATLCFVDDQPTEDPIHQQPAVVAPTQLAFVWRELAQGKALNLSCNELDTVPEGSAFALVYTSSNHNPELIESVLLRNAHYPGEWDAAKESLWKVLPPPPSSTTTTTDSSSKTSLSTATATTTKSSSSTQQPTGDEHWLAELRDSAAATLATAPVSAPLPSDVMKTPPLSRTGSSKKAAAASASANDSAQKDVAVDDFFANLLK